MGAGFRCRDVKKVRTEEMSKKEARVLAVSKM